MRTVLTLPSVQREHFQEAIAALRYNLLRPAHVIAWTGFFDLLAKQLVTSKADEIRAVRQKWPFSTVQELLESQTESGILDAAKDVGYIKRAEWRILQGFLSIRNQCAHPTDYKPTMNASLGYVDDMIHRTMDLLR